MKKVEKVSIADISFTLDHDAYVSLKQYIDSLKDYYCKDPDGGEIIADIEARIAELILDEQVYTKIVPASLIDSIVAQLGRPEEIDDVAGENVAGENSAFSGASSGSDSGTKSSGASSGSDSGTKSSGASSGSDSGTKSSGATYSGRVYASGEPEPSIPRRLYRIREGRVIGGVCSGIARFWDINVVWIRLGFIVGALLEWPVRWSYHHPFPDGIFSFSPGWSWAFPLLYLILWIALPMAKSPRQKLEARGQKITPESIRQSLQESVSTPSGRKAASLAAEIFTVVGRIVLFFIKFVAAIVGFSLIIGAMACLASAFALIIDPDLSWEASQIMQALAGMTILSPLWLIVLVLLCAMMPLLVLGIAVLSFVFSWRLGSGFYIATLGLWLLAMIFGVIVIGNNARLLRHEFPERLEQQEYLWDGRYDDGRYDGHFDRDCFDDTDSDNDSRQDSSRVRIRRIE